MFSSNLTRDYHAIQQCTLCMTILVFDAAISVWLTKNISLFSNRFCEYFLGDVDAVISVNGETLAY